MGGRARAGISHLSLRGRSDFRYFVGACHREREFFSLSPSLDPPSVRPSSSLLCGSGFVGRLDLLSLKTIRSQLS